MQAINSARIRWKLLLAIMVLVGISFGSLYIVNGQTLAQSSASFVHAQGAGMSHFFLAIEKSETSASGMINHVSALLENVKPIPGVDGYLLFVKTPLVKGAKASLVAQALSSKLRHTLAKVPSLTEAGFTLYASNNVANHGMGGLWLLQEEQHPGIRFVQANGHLATFAPMMLHGQLIGITEVDQTPTESAIPLMTSVLTLNFFKILVIVAAMLIVFYFLLGRWVVSPIRYQAEHDLLTGLYNQITFWRLFAGLSQQMRAQEQGLAMLTLDMDHFKAVNDTYGHQVGDDVLQMLASVLKKHVRKMDVIGRMGGEEFGVLLPTCSEDKAMMIAERIREEVATKSLDEGRRKLSVSIGVSTSDLVKSFDPRVIAQGADLALYVAKRSGRNQTRCYEEGMTMATEPSSQKAPAH